MTAYDADFYTWMQDQAALLREGAVGELDLAHLAEEVESLGQQEKRALRSQMIRVLAHLLKWLYQPGGRFGHSWQDSITDARTQILLALEDSPSLKCFPEDTLVFAYLHARRQTTRETGLPLVTFPDTCPWTAAQVLADDFWLAADQEDHHER